MYKANVYKIMFGSPSDMIDLFDVFKQVIYDWNNVNSESENIVLLPLHWSFSTHPTMGSRPQESINKQVTDKSDMLICVFGTRIGTPTGAFDSGTIEEIKEHTNAGKEVMIYFKKSVADITSVDLEQLKKLEEFKTEISKIALIEEFSDGNEFKEKLRNHIQMKINANWKQEYNESYAIDVDNEITFSDNELDILTKWVNSDDGIAFSNSIQNVTFYTIGKEYYRADNHREKANYEDFFQKLKEEKFVKIKKHNKQGLPVYELTKKAYDYIEKIDK